MSRYLQQNKRAFLIVSFFGLGLAALSSLVALFPFECSRLNLAPAKMRQISQLILIGCLYLTTASYAIFQILAHLEGRLSLLALSGQPRTFASQTQVPGVISLGVISLLCLLILGQSLTQLTTPLDWDELDTVSRLVSPELAKINENNPYQNSDVLSPLKNTRNHTLANLASLISFKLFGVGPKVARLPAVLFTLAFLAALCFFGHALFSPSVIIFTLLHLAANGLFIWYSHSMRGYLSMVLFTSLALFFILPGPQSRRRFSALGLVLSGVACAFTHTFASLFYLSLMFSYLIWIALESKRWSESEVKYHWRRLGIGLTTVPLIAYILIRQFLFLKQIGYLYTASPLQAPEPLLSVFGITSPAAAFLMVTLIVVLVTTRVLREGFDFLSVFLGLSALSLFLLVTVLKTTLFEVRFLLAFLPPLALWSFSTIEQIPQAALKGALAAAAFGLLVIMPLQGRAEIYRLRTARMASFSDFINRVQTEMKDELPQCLTAAGESDETFFTQGFYFFRTAKNLVNSKTCPRQYKVFYSRDWSGDHTLTANERAHLTEKFRDSSGRIFYQKNHEAAANRLARYQP